MTCISSFDQRTFANLKTATHKWKLEFVAFHTHKLDFVSKFTLDKFMYRIYPVYEANINGLLTDPDFATE